MLAIIDAESYIYKAACNCSTLCQLPDGKYIEAYSIEQGMDWLRAELESLASRAGCSEYVLVVGNVGKNFRKVLNPNYKANRKNQKKPIMLDVLKQKVNIMMPIRYNKCLEADDTCRILLEQNKDAVLISIDKDLRTISGKVFDSYHDTIRYISPIQAEANFKRQLLMGDSADGYGGLPKVGKATADKLLAQGITIDDIAQMYIDKGLTLDDFKTTYNMAKIIGKDDYKDGVITLYNGEHFDTRNY